MSVAIKCQQCGAEFHVRPARRDAAKFCSYGCRGKWRSENWTGKDHPNWLGGVREKRCEVCGKKFSWNPGSAISTFRKQRFCSRECGWAGQEYKSGSDHPNWRDDRETRRNARNGRHRSWATAVISRDGAKCRRCGADGVELHAHHVKSWRDYPSLRWDVDNGITLCAPCHWHVHALSANGVNSGEPVTGKADGNPEPSDERKPVEGVTTRGRAYRRFEGNCEWCGAFMSKRWSDVKNNAHVFCSRQCAGKFKAATRTWRPAKNLKRPRQ